FGGTSGATPVVAGICALMLSANPNLTAREVKQILQSTADKVGNSWEYVSGYSTKYGYGRVNAAKAVAEAIRRRSSSTTTTRPTTTESTTTTTTTGTTSSGNVTVRPSTGTSTSTTTTTTTTSSSSSSGNLGKDLYRFNVQQQVAAGWGVQVGVFASYGNVLKQAADLQRKFGEPILVQISTSGSTESYKVVVGSYNSSRDAQELLNKLRVQGLNGFVRNLSDFG
ncbi:MAG: SPOR domain-containing protein, partial [Phaeodactylibacter sp.]|nr:SPOR domain-containing protein [Phaeodactylibacter sp.]